MYVGNLSYNTNESQLRELFGQFGTVADAKVVMDRDTGRPRGFAFVEMASDAEMAKAIEGLNGRELDGRALNVSEARERTGGGGGGWWRRRPRVRRRCAAAAGAGLAAAAAVGIAGS
jgi:RNA recognition motif-containing protein